MSPCPECLFCYFFNMYPPPLSLHSNLNSSLFIVLPGPSPFLPHCHDENSFLSATCRLLKSVSNSVVQHIPLPPWKVCNPWCSLKWNFKGAAKQGINVLCRTVCSVATWSQTGNRNVFSACWDRKYMCDMHAHSPSPRMHVEQTLNRHVFLWVCCGGVKKKKETGQLLI